MNQLQKISYLIALQLISILMQKALAPRGRKWVHFRRMGGIILRRRSPIAWYGLIGIHTILNNYLISI